MMAISVLMISFHIENPHTCISTSTWTVFLSSFSDDSYSFVLHTLLHFRPLVLWLQFCVVVYSVLVAMSTVLYDCDCTYAFTDIFTNGNSSTRLICNLIGMLLTIITKFLFHLQGE